MAERTDRKRGARNWSEYRPLSGFLTLVGSGNYSATSVCSAYKSAFSNLNSDYASTPPLDMTYCPDLAPGAHRGSAQLRSEKRLEDFRIQPSSNRGAALRKVASLMKKSAAQGDFCISGLMERPSRTAAQTPGAILAR
jgi:hypothetical protein